MKGRALWLILLGAWPLRAAKLTPATVEAFERYVRQTDARAEAELRGGPFLWIERQSEPQRRALEDQLRRGEIAVEERKPAKPPDGRIHHWIGLVFVPGVTLRQTQEVTQDYEHYQDFHRPYIQRSRLIQREGGAARILLRLYRKKGLTAVMDTVHEVRYTPLDATRGHSRTHTTRVVEIDNAGRADEREKPASDDRGFLWRHVSYWRFREADGGTYVQYEAVSLSRDLPTGVGWLIGSFLRGAHKDFLINMINGTRNELVRRRDMAR